MNKCSKANNIYVPKNTEKTIIDNKSWDCIAITASNVSQANSYLKQIEFRKSIGKIDKNIEFIVVADKDDKRVGSGGSTLSVIKELKSKYKDFNKKKFLVIHGGGDSKRCPQYSAIGKLFSPVPCCINDTPATLFDFLLLYTSSLSLKIEDGMFLLPGDVVLLFDTTNIKTIEDEAAVISFKENSEVAKNHGVYVKNNQDYVNYFLHKQDIHTLNKFGAIDTNGDCNIDTGIIYLSSKILNKLEELVSDKQDYHRFVNDRVRLSLYGDIEYCLALSSSLDDYYLQTPEGEYCKELKATREQLWNKISSYNMKLISIDDGKFLHFGTVKEILSLLNDRIDKYKKLGWSKSTCSIVHNDVATYNSIVSDNAIIGKNTYLENSYVHNNARIGNNCYISSTEIDNITIPNDLLIHCLKQNNGKYICRIIGIDDNPKDNKIFGYDIDELIEKYKLENVFKNDKHSLWDANLFIESYSAKEAIKLSLYVYELLNGKNDNVLFNSSNRSSLCSGFNNADTESIIHWSEDLTRLYKLNNLINNNVSVENAIKLIEDKLSDIEINWLKEKSDNFDGNNLSDFSYLMRFYYYVGNALKEDKYINECFSLISNTIVKKAINNLEYNASCKIKKNEATVKLPLRVNFGGGWSDTPPHCMEHGGKVINAAITLNGQLPVQVTLTKIDEKKIIFKSKDLNTYTEYEDLEALQKVGDATDPNILQKSCLLACGIIPKKGGNLKEILGRIGGGFILDTNVYNVPKGSGLGTSSILAAACAKAMFEFMEIEYSESKLCSTVLAIEQLMSTGGGWQDQIGGMSNGIKFISSNPGIEQIVNIEHLNISNFIKNEFSNRYCIIYTGQQRLAKNILRDVVGRYIGNNKESIDAHIKIQEVAIKMKECLINDNFDEFTKLLNYHWELSKQIDSDSSNEHIENIFALIDDLIDAKMIIGAGGGGFLQVILKKGISKNDLQLRLNKQFNDSDIKAYESEICW